VIDLVNYVLDKFWDQNDQFNVNQDESDEDESDEDESL